MATFLRHLAESAPKMLKKGEPEVDSTLLSFWLGRELADELLSALNETRLELVPRHADDTLLINGFWDELVCEVAANPHGYLNHPHVISDLITEFGDRWKKPLSAFDLVYSIHYLALGQEPISLLGVEFFAPTDEALTKRAIPKSEIAAWRKKENNFTLALVRVEAASSEVVFEAGKGQVVDAITLLKMAALRGLAERTPTDELLQWSLSSYCLVRPAITGEAANWNMCFNRQFGPLVTELGDYILKGIQKLRLEELTGLPEEIRDRILRAIYWITHSATHEADDHRLVDLCTALEVLLTPEGSSRKAKSIPIALRYNLLGGDLYPSAVKWMYDRRNNVVHGDPLPVVGPMDIWHLRLVCYETITRLVDAFASRPDVSTLQELIGTVETKERLLTFVDRAGKGIYGEDSSLPNLIKEAKTRIRESREE